MLSRTHWRPHATSSPRRFSLALEMGPPLKLGKSALGTRLEAARNLVPRAPVRGLKRPGDEVGKHGPHQSKYTKTGRPRIQRYVRQLIWALDVNDFGQTKKVNSRGYIYFLTLTSLFAHQSGQSFIVLECYNRKNFHRLTFHERKFFLFCWQRTPLFVLAYLWPTKHSGMWPREFFFLAWQTKPRGQESLTSGAKINCRAYLSLRASSPGRSGGGAGKGRRACSQATRVRKLLRNCGGKARHVVWKLNFARESRNCVVVRRRGADRVCRTSSKFLRELYWCR